MKTPAEIMFSAQVRRVQEERGSRAAYATRERRGGFPDRVDDELRAFLAQVDTAFLATASRDGQPYVQHRGGPPGFIRPLDEHTLGFVDFSGNRQYVSTGNLRENDKAFLFLFVPEQRARVKVWGTARMVPLDDALRAALSDEGYEARPEQALLFTVTAWDANCPQHIVQRVRADVALAAVQKLERRIAALEAENRRLRGH